MYFAIRVWDSPPQAVLLISAEFFAGPTATVSAIRCCTVRNVFAGNVVKQWFFICLWWRQLAAGLSMKCASCRGGWGERSYPRNVTAIHSVAVGGTPNLPIKRRTKVHLRCANAVKFHSRALATFKNTGNHENKEKLSGLNVYFVRTMIRF